MAYYGALSAWERRACKREPQLSARQIVAYHEGGHVVIGLRNGVNVMEAWVNDAGRGGRPVLPRIPAPT